MKKIYYKNWLLFIIIFYSITTRSNADCTLTVTATYPIASITALACLNCTGTSCATTTLVIPTGVTATIAQNTSWDFSAFTSTPITIRIEGTGGIHFEGGTGNAATLILPPGSKIEITNTSNTNALTAQTGSGTGNIGRITIGSMVYTQSRFPDIIAGGGVDEAGFLLPVTLISFTARTEGSSIDLQWATATEENNDYFLLQHSLDGRKFEELTRLQGAGSTQEPQAYRFLHKGPPRGLNYYRLVQVDYDGATNYFDVISVEFKGKGDEWILQPNPAQDFLELINTSTSGQTAQAHLYSLTGREIKKQQLESGSKTRLDLPAGLPKGVYLLRLESGRDVVTKRVLVQ